MVVSHNQCFFRTWLCPRPRCPSSFVEPLPCHFPVIEAAFVDFSWMMSKTVFSSGEVKITNQTEARDRINSCGSSVKHGRTKSPKRSSATTAGRGAHRHVCSNMLFSSKSYSMRETGSKRSPFGRFLALVRPLKT